LKVSAGADVMPKLAVIIPYFQREPGILRRSLQSIFDQTLNARMEILIIVVDDSSPLPASDELQMVDLPGTIKIKLVERTNGGPGAARNTGLDHVPAGTDFVAFIDSDDTWRGDHLERAVTALGHHQDVYFSDHMSWDGDGAYLPATAFAGHLRGSFGAKNRKSAGLMNVCILPSSDLVPFLVREYLAQTSTIVYRFKAFPRPRFDESLRPAGEDHLFFFDLVAASREVCLSTEVEVELGRGINIYRSAVSWDNPQNLPRCYSFLILQKIMQQRYHLTPELGRQLAANIWHWRPVLTYMMIRNLLRGIRMPRSVLAGLWREDPLFIVWFPVNVLVVSTQWLLGKVRGVHPFAWTGGWAR
jgi:succinoglycan biosynthesis protein ExoW